LQSNIYKIATNNIEKQKYRTDDAQQIEIISHFMQEYLARSIEFSPRKLKKTPSFC